MLKDIKRIIENNNSFVIASHKNVEADTLGSSLALYILLKTLKKKAKLINQDYIPSAYRFLPYVKKFSRSFKGKSSDIYFVLDCSDLSRTGKFEKFFNDRFIVNIDHHISNTRFGNINWVDPRSSSTSEMIYRLYRYLGVPFSKDSALCIYAGILSDTGCFSFANTSSRTHLIASRLLKFGVEAHLIYQNIYNSFSVSEVKFMINILNNIKTSMGGKIVYTYSNAWRNKKNGSDLTEYILTIMRSIESCEVAVLFKVAGSKVRVNLRSKKFADVNKVASIFGGGGHQRASAVTIEGDFVSVRKKVISTIRRIINESQKR